MGDNATSQLSMYNKVSKCVRCQMRLIIAMLIIDFVTIVSLAN